MSVIDTRRQLFKELLGRDLSDADITAVGGEGGLVRNYGQNSEAAQRNEILNSQEYKNRNQVPSQSSQPSYQNPLTDPNFLANLRKSAEARLNPGLQFKLQSIDQAGNQIGLQEQGLNNQATDIGRQYDRLGQTLQEQASNARKGFEERQNSLGLLQSGLTAAGSGKITSDLTKQLGENEQDKVSKLADLALQRAGFQVNRANLETQRSAANSDYQTGVEDLVQKLISGTADEQQSSFNQQLSLAKLGGEIPSGQSVNLGPFGVVHGRATQPDAAGKLFENPFTLANIPDDILRQLLESYGFTVTD